MSIHRVRGRFARNHPYRGATAGVVTKHDKTTTLHHALGGPGGLRLRTVEVDTDVLGTFTGDVVRRSGPAETAIAKARLGIDAAGERLVLASEGSFGPHPDVAIVTRHTEVVVFLDVHTSLTVTGHAEGLAPWTFSKVVSTRHPVGGLTDELVGMLRELDPPHHRLVARPEDAVEHHVDQGITKGIGDRDDLRAAVDRAAAWSTTGRVRIETDLRAHMSQRRRALILQAAEDLAQRLAHRCPECDSPGFGHVESVRGAPCGWCRSPTDSLLAVVDGCPACAHQERHPVDGNDQADPGTCLTCNP